MFLVLLFYSVSGVRVVFVKRQPFFYTPAVDINCVERILQEGPVHNSGKVQAAIERLNGNGIVFYDKTDKSGRIL
jgi:hypothetical protein